MNRNILFFIILGIVILISCKQSETSQKSDIELWKLSWRMIDSSIDENFELANKQFDSLRNHSETIELKYLLTGLEIKNEIGKVAEIEEILSTLKQGELQEVCSKQFMSAFESCIDYPGEQVENKELQIELIKMYLNDQATRGNIMQDIMTKYDIDSTEISNEDMAVVDERNRNRLKEIFETYGFPTRALVGKDALHGVFYVIQHSDRDQEWQKAQLSKIEKAVKKGDMEGDMYAYLYDRIQTNSGEKQLYGTQFSNVDLVNRTVELAETKDMDSLDKRRMEIGLMPIAMYKALVLKNL